MLGRGFSPEALAAALARALPEMEIWSFGAYLHHQSGLEYVKGSWALYEKNQWENAPLQLSIRRVQPQKDGEREGERARDGEGSKCCAGMCVRIL